MDRRLSRANWSTKNAKKTFTPAQVSAPIIEKAPAAPAAPAQKPSPKQKRPHKIDNSGVNRRFSVKLNPQEAQSAQKAALAQFPPLPEGAEAAVSETRQQTAIDSSALLSDLSAESFDAVPYVQGYLKDATAAKIDQFARDLGDLASSNDSDVKRTITQSYNQVLAVSRTMVEAEGVLEELKGPVMKLNEILSSQAEEAQEKMDNGSNRDNRRSVLLLEKKWASNLNSLFKEVEGAQKLVSAIPGRHVVAESRRWGELNAITCKPIRPAHLIILNDHLLHDGAGKGQTEGFDRQREQALCDARKTQQELRLPARPDHEAEPPPVAVVGPERQKLDAEPEHRRRGADEHRAVHWAPQVRGGRRLPDPRERPDRPAAEPESRRAVFAAAQAEEAQMGEPQGEAREAAVLGDQQPAELEQRDRGDGGPVPDDTHGGKSARSGAGGEEQAAGQACEPAQVRRRREKIHTADVAHLLHLHQEHVSAVRAVFPRDGTEGDFRWVVERENRCLQQAVQAAADRLQRAVGALPELRKD
ncbi:hypothetical protein KL911_004535 [Ogataea haglerorum]|uniref:uncharacterized protein n=1 Tax=Ogataea haglerorum TaxID=1937702 RepID=UPI001C896357|nr:uncharacterized protein KL911_004535 [Ogataea haglerorum]KAG7751661.1 hypothetical protein KL911_004535 [Ogataea haglerorum]